MDTWSSLVTLSGSLVSAEDFAAGVDALIPVLTILATGGVTIVGGWLTAKFTRRNDELKIEAEQAREATRREHEDEAAIRALESAKKDADLKESKARAADEAGRATAVANRFLEVMRTVRDHDPERGDDADFATYFKLHWGTVNEIEVRREVGTLTDSVLRSRLNNLVMSMDDHFMASRNGSSNSGWAWWLSNMGIDFAQAAARGEEPDAETLQSYAKFFDVFTDVWDERQALP